MKKTILFLLLPVILTGCAELQEIASQIPQERGISNTEIAQGLQQALQKGIDEQVTRLAEEGGFLQNEQVRITLPPELQKVDRTLRNAGLDALADEGLRVLNRAAEDAVGEATPIFAEAVREITFTDARNILLGDDTAATRYLTARTSDQLYSRFQPIVKNSLEEVGATEVWRTIIERYNRLPLTGSVNPDLPDYVTKEALNGVFTMIAVEEKEIRNQVSARTTNLLQRVFALQD